MVLQLSQALRRLRRGRVLKFVDLRREGIFSDYNHLLKDPEAPFHKFKVASEACGLYGARLLVMRAELEYVRSVCDRLVQCMRHCFLALLSTIS